MKGAEGNFVKINLKKKSHVKGYALRGVGLRKQVSECAWQLASTFHRRSFESEASFPEEEKTVIHLFASAVHAEIPAERGAFWWRWGILWQREERRLQRGTQSPE